MPVPPASFYKICVITVGDFKLSRSALFKTLRMSRKNFCLITGCILLVWQAVQYARLGFSFPAVANEYDKIFSRAGYFIGFNLPFLAGIGLILRSRRIKRKE